MRDLSLKLYFANETTNNYSSFNNNYASTPRNYLQRISRGNHGGGAGNTSNSPPSAVSLRQIL